MKKNLLLVLVLSAAVGCESTHSNREENDSDSISSEQQAAIIKESSGSQSQSSDPNQSSSSLNVGQSGNITPSATESSVAGRTNTSAPRNSP